MVRVVGIQFNDSGKIYSFDSLDLDIKKGQGVVVETIHGKEMGFATVPTHEASEEEEDRKLKPVIRIATDYDLERYRENVIKAAEAIKVCRGLVEKYELDMKLVDCSYTFDNQKLLFYFNSEGRVDFRELVKELAYIYRTRIELRQIGVRDGARMLGGIGPCGQVLCCTRFLKDFDNVTIKMAKAQGLSLTPSKISGMCGRLMCCLNYEQEVYEERLKELPALKEIVITPEGEGKVVERYAIRGEVKVQVMKNDSYEYFNFAMEDLKRKKDEHGCKDCKCPMKNKKD